MTNALEETFQCVTCDKWIRDVVMLVGHDCDRIIPFDSLSDKEKSTLLYVESCVVDQQPLDRERLDMEDEQNLKLFSAAGILEWHSGEASYMHVDSFKGWDLAAKARKERGKRHL